jgi:hypothetical protein
MNPGIGGLSMAPEYKEDKPAGVSDAWCLHSAIFVSSEQ